jgi:hypothetical protein
MKANPPIANPFSGKPKEPTDKDLAAVLGKAKSVWDRLLAELDKELGVNVREWNCYSAKSGWSLRVKRKARTIAWLAPREGAFVAAFILGDKAIEAAHAAKLPRAILKAIQTAPKYPEGSGVRIPVKTASDLAGIKALAALKLAN